VGSTMYALQIIEGRLSGTIYDLPPNREFVLGRASQLEIVIDEDMVSRRHAKINTYHDGVVIQDLNSTNGTLVNQQQISGGHRLNLNDEITIGSCVIRVIANQSQDDHQASYANQNQYYNNAAPIQPTAPVNKSFTIVNQSSPYPQPNYNQNPVSQQQIAPNYQHTSVPNQYNPPPAYPQPNYAMPNNHFSQSTAPKAKPRVEQGEFPSIEFSDTISMMQKLVERRHDGLLEISDNEEREAYVYFRSGNLYFASLENQEQMLHPNQALLQLACWTSGKYKIKPLATLPSFEIELSGDSRALLDQVKKESQHYRNLRSQLPPLQNQLQLVLPLDSALSVLSEIELNILQLCINGMNIGNVIHYHPNGDLEGIQCLIKLIETRYLKP
jgi:hypothetical protein